MGFWTKLFGGDDGGEDTCPERMRIGEIRNGKRNGRWIERDATVTMDRTYVDGVLNGTSRAWYPDGKLQDKTTFVDGKREGVGRRYHPGGILAAEVSYLAGKIHGRYRTFDERGELIRDCEYRNDTLWTGPYALTGVERGQYKNGKKDGLWEAWMYDKKTIKERGTYVDGQRHGEFELRETEWQSWHGTFERGERVGTWEVRRRDSKLVARGMYPAGTPTSWTIAELGETAELATTKELDVWIYRVEQEHKRREEARAKAAAAEAKRNRPPKEDRWSADERARSRARMLSAAPLSDTQVDPDEGLPFEARARELLVHATGDIAALAHPTPPTIADDDREYMKHWVPPTMGTMVVVGTVELPDHMVVDSPPYPGPDRVFSFRPGTYELVGLDGGERLFLRVVIVRIRGAAIATWRYLGMADDSDIGLFAASLDLERFDWPEHPGEHVTGPAEWIRTDVGPSVWITNPTGNGIRAFAGVDDVGDIVAIFFQLY